MLLVHPDEDKQVGNVHLLLCNTPTQFYQIHKVIKNLVEPAEG